MFPWNWNASPQIWEIFLISWPRRWPSSPRSSNAWFIPDGSRSRHSRKRSGRRGGTFLVGCGTASYAALTGAYLFSRIAGIHVNFVLGSEFKYQEHFLTPDSLVVALSQSGETADIIEGMLAAQRRGARLGALVNARRSTLDRMVDLSVHLQAGPEQCVLSTKAYSAKVAALILAAHSLAGSYEQGEAAVLAAAAGMRQMLRPRGWIKFGRLPGAFPPAITSS